MKKDNSHYPPICSSSAPTSVGIPRCFLNSEVSNARKDALYDALEKELLENGTSRQKTSTDFKNEVKNMRLAFIDMFLKHRTLARELLSHCDLDAKNKAEPKRLKALQLPLETPIEDLTVLEDANLHIMTEILDQKFGCCHGKVVRGMGKVRVRETGALETLKGKIATWKAQIAVQFSAQDKKMSMILQTLQMSGLQILMLAPDLASPSTSQPLRPVDTQ